MESKPSVKKYTVYVSSVSFFSILPRLQIENVCWESQAPPAVHAPGKTHTYLSTINVNVVSSRISKYCKVCFMSLYFLGGYGIQNKRFQNLQPNLELLYTVHGIPVHFT